MSTIRGEVTGRRVGASEPEDCETPPKPSRFIDKKEVLRRVPWSYPTIWQKMRLGKFPRSRDLDGKSFWIEAEVEEWINSTPIRPLKGDPVSEPPLRHQLSKSPR